MRANCHAPLPGTAGGLDGPAARDGGERLQYGPLHTGPGWLVGTVQPFRNTAHFLAYM